MAEQPRKIKKYRKPLNLNIGMLIFGAIFIYVIICVILYFQTDHIVRYEVTEGSLATNNIYRGVSIRTEEVVSTDTAGYVNFYAREGERVAKGDTVYIVDETGRLTEELEDASLGENTLSDQELSEFRNEIVNFMHGYDDKNYESTYDFKYSLKNTVLKLANVNMLQSIENGNNGSAANIVNFCYSPTTGIVAYWTDGYENLTVEGVTQEVFDNKNYEKKQMLGNELMAVGDPVYKLSTEENTGTQGVIRQCYRDNGDISSEFVEAGVYSYDENEGVYYMDTSVLKAGDVLYKTDSQETYTVSKRATLIGVYNVNKGYADFKQINILYQNDEYSIVKANTTYGLNVYDYIVLDGSSVSDDQIITNIKKTDTGRTDIPTDSVEPGVSDNIPESTEPLPAETREEPTQETTQEATQESQTPES